MTRTSTQGPATAPGRQSAPRIIAGARDLFAGYDVLFSDVWGVVHNGLVAFETACDALVRFRKGGGTVILVSNAPVPKHRVAWMLDQRRVPREAWDDIVSSGEIALRHLDEQGYETAHYIGPRDRDQAFFERAAPKPAELHAADAIVCTGLNDDMTETAETYRTVLERGLERGLPLVCANPDLVVDVGGRLYTCAGAVADLYQHIGGSVYWAGKPYAAAYETATSVARELRGSDVPASRVLVIGDALRTDIAGASAHGIDSLFIGGGIHRHDVMTLAGDELDPGKLAALFAGDAPQATAAMPVLAW